MTVGTQISFITVDGNGVTTAFAYPFNIPAPSDAIVTYTSPTGVQTVLAPSLYTLEGTGSPTGGTVTYPLAGLPIPAGSSLSIQRTLPLVQTTSLSNQGPTFEAIETEFDYLTMLIQQVNGVAQYAIQAPSTDPAGLNYIVPSAAERANTSLGFDANGNVITGMVPSGALISAAMVPVVEAATIQEAFNLIAAEGGTIGGNEVVAGSINLSGTLAASGQISTLGVVAAGGRVSSASGGFVFPDATVQTTAATGGASGANPIAQVGTVTINGVATTFMRSDAAPSLAASGVTGGTYGSATQVAQVTFNAAGQATSASNVTISTVQGLANAANITTSISITASTLGYFFESRGSSLIDVTVLSASGINGKTLDFWAAQTSSMSLSSVSNFVGPFGTGSHQLQIGTNVYARIIADANGQWVVQMAFTSGGTPGGGGGSGGSCFLARALVTMADGTERPISQVFPGDWVMGRDGEANEVLALEPVILGDRPMLIINGECWTTDDHPIWTARGPAAFCPENLGIDWGHDHGVITAHGVEVWHNVGLKREVLPLVVGAALHWRDKLRLLEGVQEVWLPPETPLFNLVLGGSHTMRVDGYCFTGWPREDDWDYDRWCIGVLETESLE